MGKSQMAKSQFSKKFLHQGIVVKNMDKAMERLRLFEPSSSIPLKATMIQNCKGKPIDITEGVLNTSLADRESDLIEYLGQPLDSKEKVIITKIGDLELEIFEPLEGDSPWNKFLKTKGEGIHHIGFEVDDLDEEINKYIKQGARIILKWQRMGKGVYLDLGDAGFILEIFSRKNI
jgi:hypothetical protein